jgi:hypothetical protein
MLVDDPPEAVKNGDIIQLVHGITGRALNRFVNVGLNCYSNIFDTISQK